MNSQANEFVTMAMMLDVDDRENLEPQHFACDHFVAAMRLSSDIYSGLIPWLGGRSAFVKVVTYARRCERALADDPDLEPLVSSAWLKLVEAAPDDLQAVLAGLWP